jgi:hypothetical protein
MKKAIRKPTFWIAALVLLCLTVAVAQAQSGAGYDLSWWSVDGGGGSAIHAGAYTWGGTAGQPDAGALTGGAYTLQGGFWGGGLSPGERVFLPFITK